MHAKEAGTQKRDTTPKIERKIQGKEAKNEK